MLLGNMLAKVAEAARAKRVPFDLAYHPDADPGDGSGWCAMWGDRHFYGQLHEVLAQACGLAGVPA